ncbi:hypothetical protein B0H11DRAFT_1901673 [Mycena galericulata]|nr:hypothetical protein B0H11DRAFT_1901673 [Mycena galericulata]
MSGVPDGRISGTHVMVGGRVRIRGAGNAIDRHLSALSDVGNQCRLIEIQWKPLSPDATKFHWLLLATFQQNRSKINFFGTHWSPPTNGGFQCCEIPSVTYGHRYPMGPPVATSELSSSGYITPVLHSRATLPSPDVIDCINPANCCNVGLEKKETRESYGRQCSLSAGQNLQIHWWNENHTVKT